jgi:sec-independent protein translocase protein TatB
MPDVSLTEFAIIAIVVLIVFGPHRLPEISRQAGKWARELRSISREFRRGIEREVAVINEPLQEIKKDLTGPVEEIKKELKAPLEDMKEIKKELNAPLEDMKEDPTRPVDEVKSDASNPEKPPSDRAEWVGPVPPTGPTPGEARDDLDRIESGENLLDGETD